MTGYLREGSFAFTPSDRDAPSGRWSRGAAIGLWQAACDVRGFIPTGKAEIYEDGDDWWVEGPVRATRDHSSPLRPLRTTLTQPNPTFGITRAELREAPMTEAPVTPESADLATVTAIACGVCQVSYPGGITAAQAVQFIETHLPCRQSVQAFRIEVPAVLGTSGYESQAYEAWRMQASREGFQGASAPVILEPTGRVAIVEGWVAPVATERLDPMPAPGDPLPRDVRGGGDTVL